MITMTQEERDMEKYIHEQIQKVFVDLKWRCEALDIEMERWTGLLVRTLLAYAVCTSCAMMPVPKDKKKRDDAEAQFRTFITKWIDQEIRKVREIEQKL